MSYPLTTIGVGTLGIALGLPDIAIIPLILIACVVVYAWTQPGRQR